MSRGRYLLENQHIRILFLAFLLGAMLIGVGATLPNERSRQEPPPDGRRGMLLL